MKPGARPNQYVETIACVLAMLLIFGVYILCISWPHKFLHPNDKKQIEYLTTEVDRLRRIVEKNEADCSQLWDAIEDLEK